MKIKKTFCLLLVAMSTTVKINKVELLCDLLKPVFACIVVIMTCYDDNGHTTHINT